MPDCNGEYSIKISLSESEYEDLKNKCKTMEVTIKHLLNKSIRYAIKDFETNRCIRRSHKIELRVDDSVKHYSFKIKDDHYHKLKDIADLFNANVKEIVTYIISYYPSVVFEVYKKEIE